MSNCLSKIVYYRTEYRTTVLLPLYLYKYRGGRDTVRSIRLKYGKYYGKMDGNKKSVLNGNRNNTWTNHS